MKRRRQMNDTVYKLWPELEWIKDDSLREKTAKNMGNSSRKKCSDG